MKVETVRTADLVLSGRLDSAYHLSIGRQAASTLLLAKARGIPFRRLGQPDGIGKIWQPNRFKRAYASPKEESLAYLRPYDVFEYLPQAADLLSVKRNREINTYRLKAGMILQSCSGRNLGPAVIVDRFLEQFIIGDDMLRIEIVDEALRLYVLGFLKTSLAQALLRQGKTGSVIDHISEEHVSALAVPVLHEPQFSNVSELMREAVSIRERSRLVLTQVQSEYERSLPAIQRTRATALGWTVNARKLRGRIDSASYDPLLDVIRRNLLRSGGRAVREVATVLKPPGRYKTVYVSPKYGTPILSGTQLLQHVPINLQYIASRSLKNRGAYELRAGWIAYQADGRSEETLGLPVVITPDREGWLASGHVGRVVAKRRDDGGWLYAALRTPHAQMQIKALSSGSVVDATFPADMESVVLPPRLDSIEWGIVTQSWQDFARAAVLENRAVRLLEEQLMQGADLQLT